MTGLRGLLISELSAQGTVAVQSVQTDDPGHPDCAEPLLLRYLDSTAFDRSESGISTLYLARITDHSHILDGLRGR